MHNKQWQITLGQWQGLVDLIFDKAHFGLGFSFSNIVPHRLMVLNMYIGPVVLRVDLSK